MFTTLIVSGVRTRGAWRRRLAGSTFSMMAHVAIFYAAAVATMHAGPHTSGGEKDTSIVYIATPRHLEPAVPTLPRQFRTLVAPRSVPVSIPPIDVTKTFDPGAYTGIGLDVGAPTDVGGSVDPTQVFVENVVDEPPARISFPPPAYPRLLQDARIEGVVVLEAVVDTLGHPEPGSIRVVSSSNHGFDAAAKEAMRRALYQPGRVRGQRVRVLVRQPVRFALPR